MIDETGVEGMDSKRKEHAAKDLLPPLQLSFGLPSYESISLAAG